MVGGSGPSAALNIPANYIDIRIVRDGFSRLTPDGDSARPRTVCSQTSDVSLGELRDGFISLPLSARSWHGCFRDMTSVCVPRETRTMAYRRI